MTTLLLSNQKVNIETVSRDKKFYDLYEYCVSLELMHCTALRPMRHDEIDRICNVRRKMVNFGGSWHDLTPVTEQQQQNLHNFLDSLQKLQGNYKVKFSYHTMHFYVDERNLVEELCSMPAVKVWQIRQAVLDIPRDSMYIKSAKHDYRTFFKSQWVSTEQRKNLSQFLSNNFLRIGPGLNEWLVYFPNSKYVADNFFIDHNDKSILTMLSLATGIKLKRTVKLIRDK